MPINYDNDSDYKDDNEEIQEKLDVMQEKSETSNKKISWTLANF